MRAATTLVMTAALSALFASSAAAQGDLLDGLGRQGEVASRGAEYEQSVGAPTPIQIIQHKAQARAAQRIQRMETAKWYGHSPSRPRTTATPFTGQYGAQFQGQVLGRPSVYFATRPIVIVPR